MGSREGGRGSSCGLVCGEDAAQTGDDRGDLRVVVIAAGLGAAAAGRGNARACGFVGQIAADFGDALVYAFEEDCLFVFNKTREVPGRALGEEEAFAGSDFKALVHELVVVGVGEEAEIDLRTPDAFAVGVAKELAVAAVDCGSGFGAERLLPDKTAVDNDGETEFLPEASQKLCAVVVGRADEGDATVAVFVAPAGGRRKVDSWLVGGLNLEDVASAVF